MSKLVFDYKKLKILKEFFQFIRFIHQYFRSRAYTWFSKFELSKDILVDLLYKKRGRYARPFLHLGATSLIFVMVIFGPQILTDKEKLLQSQSGSPILTTVNEFASDFYTIQAEEVKQYRGGEIITHIVEDGETLSSIADKYDLKTETILWANKLTKTAKIKPGQELSILPVDGVRHKVVRGETIYSIGKKYQLADAQLQMVVDYPFNEFLNDETFDLVVGQYLMVPEGIMPQPKAAPRLPSYRYTPNDPSAATTGNFIWPFSGGIITQGYRFYHRAVDIALRSGGPILAADGGVVIEAGWPSGSGYGNRVMVDHGNGFVTLYAHMSVIQVKVGQRVARGNVLGQMGNTGRSTGTHLHFEIRRGGGLTNPFDYLPPTR